MLFDIRGKRRRFIQVIYVFLALLLGGSLVFFGIGGDAPGGLGDALGISGQGGSGGSAEFNDEIETAEATLEVNPRNEDALLALARYNYLNGQQALEVDEDQGTQVLTDEAVSNFEDSVEAWESYLKANKGTPDPAVATLVFRAYSGIALSSSSPATIQRRLDGAQQAAAVVAEERPGPNSYLDLASAAYLAGDTKAAERAAQEALKSVDESSKSALRGQLKATERQGKALQRQLKNQASGQGSIEDPFGGLDPSAAPAP
jgi:tetratricopeptide (TPR) repeat protein